MRAVLKRLSGLFHQRRAERDLDDEVRFHIETLADEFEQQGMRPEDARWAALRAFGGVEQMKERYRDRRGVPFFETMLQDLRHSVRGLLRSPGFTLAAVLSLALGIGANTAIFSLVNTLMLRMLPVREPERLVSLYLTNGWSRGFTSYPLYQTLRNETSLYEGVLARSAPWRVRFRAGTGDRPEFLFQEYVSENYFDVLGVSPQLGRFFAGATDSQRHPFIVLSHDFWQARFGGDPSILGRVLTIDEQPVTVIGVARKGFRGVQLERRADAWVPVRMHRGRIDEAGFHFLWLLARPRPGLSHNRLQARTDAVVHNFLEANYGRKADTPWRRKAMEQRIEVRPGGIGISSFREEFRKPLVLLMGVVGLILLIACANIANLLLARGAARRRENALRLALGASRFRLVRQWLTEAILLGGAGALAGAAFGIWASRSAVMLLPEANTAVTLDVRPDVTVLLFTTAVSIGAVLLFGVLPALRSTDIDPATALQGGSTGGTGRGLRLRLRKALLVAQVALSVVLVSGAAIFNRSLLALKTIDTGFSHYEVLGFRSDFPAAYQDRQKALYRQRLVQRLAALPGVAAVSYGMPGPYQGGRWTAGLRVPGSLRTAHAPAEVELQGVSPRYFETIGSRPIRGREFRESDTASSRKVALVNEAFAHEFFGGADPVGRILSFDDKEPQGGAPVVIVGEARNMLHHGVREKAVATVYLPASQQESGSDPMILVRANLGPGALLPALRHEVSAIDPVVALTDALTVQQRLDDSIFLDRLLASVSGFFAMLALILAGIGLYGVMSYSVAQRTTEIGIRMALGAGRAGVLRLVLGEGLLMISLGAAIGVPLAVFTTRLASGLLFGIRPGDPLSFAITIAFLLLVGSLAAGIPARRAASLAPSQALRHD